MYSLIELDTIKLQKSDFIINGQVVKMVCDKFNNKWKLFT